MRRNGFDSEESVVTELVLYIDNTSELMGPGSQGAQIKENLRKKMRRGSFEPERAARAFEYLADSGAKMYAKEFGGSSEGWHEMFPKSVRRKAAAEMAEQFIEEEQVQGTYRPNFLRKKRELTPEELAAQEIERLRDSRVWKDKYNYFRVSEGLSRDAAHERADEATREYWERKRRQEGKDVAFARNSGLRPERDHLDEDLVQVMYESYLEAALWSSTDDDDEPMDEKYDIGDFSEEAQDRAADDVVAFLNIEIDGSTMYELIMDPESLLSYPTDRHYPSQKAARFSMAGYDFWMTRVGHGVGFWDGDWDEPAGEQLTEASKELGEVWIYAGDDGEIYFT